jgi:hypothetical protein
MESTTTKQPLPVRDLLISFGFAGANAGAHLLWNRVDSYPVFVATAIGFTVLLMVWLVREWRRLTLTMTKFYCAAATLDLLAEGLLQPWHHCTLDNLACTGRLYLVFVVYWLIVAGTVMIAYRTANKTFRVRAPSDSQK